MCFSSVRTHSTFPDSAAAASGVCVLGGKVRDPSACVRSSRSRRSVAACPACGFE